WRDAGEPASERESIMNMRRASPLSARAASREEQRFWWMHGAWLAVLVVMAGVLLGALRSEARS
ncbi:MAG: hypothetical protein AAF411_14975, partial [Myxococcota bacterium]